MLVSMVLMRLTVTVMHAEDVRGTTWTDYHLYSKFVILCLKKKKKSNEH